MSLEWNDVVLKDVLSEKGYIRGPFGSALKRAEMKSEGIPVYEQQNAIYDNRIFRYYINEEKYQSLKRFTTYTDDLIISCSGTVGKVSIIKHDDPKGIISQALLTLRVNKDLILPEFLKYFFSSYEGYNSLVSRATGSVQVNISKRAVIEEIPLKLPPLDVQRKIVHYLSLIDKKIETNEKINKNLDELCHSLFKYYFIDFIPFCDDDFIDSDIGEIPKEWSITTVGNILDCKLGGTPSRSNESYWGGSIAWINSGKVNDFRIIEPSEYITEKGLKKSATKLLPAKTTVIAITGATLGQISLLEIDSCANQSVIGIIPNINYPYEFVYPLISSILIDLLKHQTGGAQQHINKNNVESFKIICPPAEIISEYKTIVSPIYSKISDNCFEIEKLQKLRDTLLPKLMSGEIDVSKINCDLELKYNYMKYLFNQIHTPMSKSVV